MEPSFVGMFIGWFFQKFMVFFVHQKHSKEARSPKPKVSNRGLSVFNLLKKTTGPINIIGTKLGRNGHWLVL
jgi:hypothetical protein